ncbi:MAG: type II toxin-antitoxin system prevent-host-death family antitoxin [Acidobacteria bacterium]|nr:type II toxin-antitoxin system prevent-host-death family antitoxin [Chloroflexota bacterium]MYN63804.1 type II toxin-antitoxin system prevent-host-death family antitoxin [Acidobacteriota bacterium]
MELAVREAKARLSELIAAAEKGERVVITRHGVPAVELVRCRRRGGIDFDKLEETRRRLGIEDAPEEEVAEWRAAFEDPAFSRQVLGLEDE